MIKRFVRTTCLLLLGFGLSGCETYKPRYAVPNFVPANVKRVYITQDAYSKEKRKRGMDIAASFVKRGVEAQLVEPNAVPPSNMDAYVTCQDHWTWDLTMFLDFMQLELRDAHSGQVLASARYKQGWVHRYPDPDEIVDNLVGQLLGEAPAKRPSRRAAQAENAPGRY